MIIRVAAAVMLCLPSLTFAQSLGEIARKTEESRTASRTPAMKLDQRDVDARMQDPELLEFRFDRHKHLMFQRSQEVVLVIIYISIRGLL